MGQQGGFSGSASVLLSCTSWLFLLVQAQLFEESCLWNKSGKWLGLGKGWKGCFSFRQILVVLDGATLVTHAVQRAPVCDLIVGTTDCTGQGFPELALSPQLPSVWAGILWCFTSILSPAAIKDGQEFTGLEKQWYFQRGFVQRQLSVSEQDCFHLFFLGKWKPVHGQIAFPCTL